MQFVGRRDRLHHLGAFLDPLATAAATDLIVFNVVRRNRAAIICRRAPLEKQRVQEKDTVCLSLLRSAHLISVTGNAVESVATRFSQRRSHLVVSRRVLPGVDSS